MFHQPELLNQLVQDRTQQLQAEQLQAETAPRHLLRMVHEKPPRPHITPARQPWWLRLLLPPLRA